MLIFNEFIQTFIIIQTNFNLIKFLLSFVLKIIVRIIIKYLYPEYEDFYTINKNFFKINLIFRYLGKRKIVQMIQNLIIFLNMFRFNLYLMVLIKDFQCYFRF
jgi:hypothetical protein